MNKISFLTIFPTIGSVDVVSKTLPTIIEETKSNNARLIVRQSGYKDNEKIEYLKSLNSKNEFTLIITSILPLGISINACMYIGRELYNPDYISVVEDDHGYKSGFIKNITLIMKKYYGKKSPNGLRWGLFSACGGSCGIPRMQLKKTSNGHLYPGNNFEPTSLGGVTNCCICAPVSHWLSVLKGYDVDEYLISSFQVKNLRLRNYNKGYTFMIPYGGKYMFSLKRVGRGVTAGKGLRLWDRKRTKSDKLSRYKKLVLE